MCEVMHFEEKSEEIEECVMCGEGRSVRCDVVRRGSVQCEERRKCVMCGEERCDVW